MNEVLEAFAGVIRAMKVRDTALYEFEKTYTMYPQQLGKLRGGVKQEVVAKLANVPQPIISRFENGSLRHISKRTLVRLLKVYSTLLEKADASRAANS